MGERKGDSRLQDLAPPKFASNEANFILLQKTNMTGPSLWNLQLRREGTTLPPGEWKGFKCENYTVKPDIISHSKIDKTKVLIANGSLMKVESIAECSSWSILQYFDLH